MAQRIGAVLLVAAAGGLTLGAGAGALTAAAAAHLVDAQRPPRGSRPDATASLWCPRITPEARSTWQRVVVVDAFGVPGCWTPISDRPPLSLRADAPPHLPPPQPEGRCPRPHHRAAPRGRHAQAPTVTQPDFLGPDRTFRGPAGSHSGRITFEPKKNIF